jgi:Ser/Thr protein kinase RdoA (MazF antagonist)
MIPSTILRQARTGFGLTRGHVRVLSTRFGKVCLAHTGRACLRTQIRLVKEAENTPARLDAEMAWLTHLASRHSCPVPIPQHWRNGALVSPALVARDGTRWFAVACSWVQGRHLNLGLRGGDMRRAGALLATLHNANRDAPATIAASRPTWGIPRLFELATTLRDIIGGTSAPPDDVPLALVASLRASHGRLDSAWQTLPTGATHAGLIHTDAHWQNLRWTRERVGLVDFEDVATGRFMLDLACLWGKVETRRGAAGMLDAILEGYDRVRPLPHDAARDLQVMLAFRRFDYAGWVLSWPRRDSQPWGPDFLAGTPAYIDRKLSR